ncbi:MAG: phytanoyl-CoA dioxygenase family protein [Planctomycetota bacterium]|nr:phytanoyl-CoA dioxygenase family protein [Planctomycetota bacterium]MDA1139049.1 phytanoyl-CoA dioxygenase family protein [Planctomycetota bacterium]
MDSAKLATQLIVEGYTVIPDAVQGEELEKMSDAFERRAAELKKRWMGWDEIACVPELMAYIGHPRVMAVIDAFYDHFGQTAAFACCSGIRDVYDPEKPPGDFDPTDLENGPIGWHDDVTGMKNPSPRFLQTTVTTLIYLDDTFVDNGAYCTSVGSHHLVCREKDGGPVLASRTKAIEHCELRPLPVKAGSVIAHRAHSWHGVVPPRQRRRVMLQCFAGREVYDIQNGHTQVSDEVVKLVPEPQRKYLCWYSK